MKMTLSTNHAAHLLASDENGGWSYSGATALVEYLEELEDGTGEEVEFDAVALRCDYSEYKNLQAWFIDYHGGKTIKGAFESAGIDIEGLWIDGEEDEEEIDDLIRSFIQDRGDLIEFDGGVIVSSF
tara:strand:+ start:912 stop:1292 length:381 start_codon:yes stop_codon:yes gene_type:complete